MKTPEDEAFDELARRQGMWGGGFHAKRAAAADKLHWSDCAVHNGPAYPAGECDCGVAPKSEREALKLALEALETLMLERGSIYEQAITAIKEALAQPAQDGKCKCVCHDGCAACRQMAQPAQEPVAWAVVGDGKFGKYEIGRETLTDIDSANYWISRGYKLVSIYTTPPQRPWVGLTDEELADCLDMSIQKTCRAIEAQLKEKNS